MDPSRCNIWLLVITGEGRQPRLLITACGTGYGRLLAVAFLVWAYIMAVGDRPQRCGRCQWFISHRAKNWERTTLPCLQAACSWWKCQLGRAVIQHHQVTINGAHQKKMQVSCMLLWFVCVYFQPHLTPDLLIEVELNSTFGSKTSFLLRFF